VNPDAFDKRPPREGLRIIQEQDVGQSGRPYVCAVPISLFGPCTDSYAISEVGVHIGGSARDYQPVLRMVGPPNGQCASDRSVYFFIGASGVNIRICRMERIRQARKAAVASGEWGGPCIAAAVPGLAARGVVRRHR